MSVVSAIYDVPVTLTLACSRDNSFVTFGSPLIDLIVSVDVSFLDRFNLKANDAIAISGENEIFEAVEVLQPKYIVGGCALNTARVLKHVSKKTVCTVIGAVGDDNYCRLIKTQLERDNVQYVFATLPKTTGRCVVLLNSDNRSLCTDLGASKFFTVEHLNDVVRDCISKAKCIYIPGFFLSVSVECVFDIARKASGKIFALNLSAPFIVEKYTQEILKLLPYVDVLFGNEAEVRALAIVLGSNSENFNGVTKFISTLKLNNKHKSMITVITRGSKPVCLIHDDQVTEHIVKELEKSQIKDTSAAGDAFVGGFLGSFMDGKSLDVCVSSGVDIAQTVIQYNGCLSESPVQP